MRAHARTHYDLLVVIAWLGHVLLHCVYVCVYLQLSKWNIDIAVTLDEHRTANPVGDMGPEKEINLDRILNSGGQCKAPCSCEAQALMRLCAAGTHAPVHCKPPCTCALQAPMQL